MNPDWYQQWCLEQFGYYLARDPEDVGDGKYYSVSRTPGQVVPPKSEWTVRELGGSAYSIAIELNKALREAWECG